MPAWDEHRQRLGSGRPDDRIPYASDSGVLLAPAGCQQAAACEMDEARNYGRVNLALLLLTVAEVVADQTAIVHDMSADLCASYNPGPSTRAREVTAGRFPSGRPMIIRNSG